MQIDSVNSIAFLTFPSGTDYPRLTRSALQSISQLLERILEESAFRGVVIRANESSFAAGADIEELSQLDGPTGRQFAAEGQALFDRIAAFPLPVVAAIRGFCLGGGLDLALACHARVATFDSAFGHPGGALGLITGWGGTQRLPRLIGKAQALQMILTCERIPATQALTLGLVDELVAGQDLTEAAARRCERLALAKSGGHS
ncbi:MAG: enoyl-CoA hydratase/isomerase family protein [Acidobacteria bacterium]|nr:enoyl-CoA hydratase/isomerase family protein [Acidobacteriota bacterium]